MAKKSEKSCIIDVLKAEIGSYSGQLRDCIDRGALLKAYQTRRRSERLYAYHSILRDACCSCFRGTSMSNDGKKCQVWGFNGRYWAPLSPVVFRDSVGQALIAAAGAGLWAPIIIAMGLLVQALCTKGAMQMNDMLISKSTGSFIDITNNARTAIKVSMNVDRNVENFQPESAKRACGVGTAFRVLPIPHFACFGGYTL